MADERFSSDDAAIEFLANALLLNAFVASEQHLAFMKMMKRNGTSRPGDQEKMRHLGGECRDLWHLLGDVGVLDRRIDMPIDITSASQTEPLGASPARVNDLVNSDADIATLRLRDFRFPQCLLDYPDVRYSLAAADLYELRTPLAMFGPTQLTHALKEAVFAYYRGEISGGASIFAHDPFALPDDPEPAEAEAEAKGGGPRSGADIALEECAKIALGAMAEANPGVRMLKPVFVTAVIDFMRGVEGRDKFGVNAAGRVWDHAAATEWKNSRRPANGERLLTADDLRPYLLAELGGRSESREPAPEPPPAWAELLQPRPWPAGGETPK